MKYVFYVLSLFLLSSQSLHAEDTCLAAEDSSVLTIIDESESTETRSKQEKEQDDNTGPQVLQQFGGVVMSFLTLLQDPNNSEHALTQVGNMVQGFVNIGKIATRRNDSSSLERKLNEFFETEDGQAFLADWRQLLKVNSTDTL